MAARCLVGTAESASGLEGCATAEQREVDVLLGSLLSVVAMVRESALKVSLIIFISLFMTDLGAWQRKIKKSEITL